MNNQKEYIKPFIEDEDIEIEDIVANSNPEKEEFETDEI